MNNKYVINEILKMGFKYSGVRGIYVLDRIAFKDKFDEDGKNDWDKSSGKKKLQEWAEKNLTKETLKQFDVDIPTIEEVFSQKMLDLHLLGRKFKSRQFPLFMNSDNRMMEFYDIPVCWWTKTAYAGHTYTMWYVVADGVLDHDITYCAYGFVPVLRRKKVFIKCKTVLA